LKYMNLTLTPKGLFRFFERLHFDVIGTLISYCVILSLRANYSVITATLTIHEHTLKLISKRNKR